MHGPQLRKVDIFHVSLLKVDPNSEILNVHGNTEMPQCHSFVFGKYFALFVRLLNVADKSPSRTLPLKIVSSGIGLFGFGHGPSELEQLEVLLDGSPQQHSGFGFSRGRHSRLDLCQHPQHPQSNRAKYESEECEKVPYSVNFEHLRMWLGFLGAQLRQI